MSEKTPWIDSTRALSFAALNAQVSSMAGEVIAFFTHQIRICDASNG
jgi:hypothetical protein